MRPPPYDRSRGLLAPWMLLALISLGGCGAAASAPAKAPTARGDAGRAAAPVTEQEVCSAPAPRPRRVALGRALPDVDLGPVAAMHIEGQQGHQAEVAKAIRTEVGAPLDPATVGADVQRLWALGLFDDVLVRARETKGGLSVTYQLDPRPAVGKLFLQGIVHLPQHVVDDAVQVRTGERFDVQQLVWTGLMLTEAYRAAGYRRAEVELHALPGDAMHLCIAVHEGPRVTIARWTFEGAHAISDQELRGQMDSRDGTANVVGGVFRPEIWAVDALRLLGLYYDRGYVEVKIGEPRIESSEDSTELAVTVNIDEGKLYHVGTIAFSGGARVARKDYGSVLTTHTGDVFNRSKLADDLARIREFHESLSAFTPPFEVTPITRVDPDRAVVDLEFQIQ